MRRISLFLIFVFTFAVFTPNIAQGASASLLLSPSSSKIEVGKSFTMNVVVNSGGGVGINAADGLIKFDPAYITVSKVSDASSIFKLWTTDPTFSNSAGTITFGGGSPGSYTGSAGTIFSVTFVSKQVGTTEVTYRSGNVLAADGLGTNIVDGLGKATYEIFEPVVEEEPEEEVVEEEPEEEEVEEKPKGLLPPIPEIDSDTHPDENTWYSNNRPEFNWKVLADLTGVAFKITDNPKDDPGVVNEGIIETETFTEQKDGEQYFHIKYQNQYGWGQVSHRKVMIDATPPEDFKLAIDDKGDSTNPTPNLVFSTTDETSGIEKYNIIIGTESFDVTPDNVSTGSYKSPVLAPGEYSATVVAVDKAGNTASSSVMFVIDPLKAPIITSVPDVISKKDDLVVQGTSFYSNVRVKVYIERTGKDTIEGEVETDESGNWAFVYKDGLDKGTYNVSAIIIDSRGAQSLSSTKHLLNVVSPSIICSYGLWIILVLLLAIALLVGYIFYQRKFFIAEKLRIKREADELKVKMSKIFYALHEEVDELIELADKKAGLSESERRVKEKLQESLDISEEFIGKEIEDIEKEIKLTKKKE
ncbi:hypothetical protein C0583_05075 [Candidatus Parcubacteria bacterium]|nr:MAG: hypothetical protein C0583_05075 [Candidatus Parcubacteria bacterium]